MPTWSKVIANVLLLALPALACANLFEGSETPSPTSAAALVPVTPETSAATVPVTPETVVVVTPTPSILPSPTLTNVPPQTRTPTPGTDQAAVGDSPQPAAPTPAWPPPVAPLAPFSTAPPSGAQQLTLAVLAQTNPLERDDLDLAAAYLGWSGELPSPTLVVDPLPVGTVQQINVVQSESNRRVEITAELLAVSQHAYFWFDTGLGSLRPSDEQLSAIGLAFDEIYADSTAIFGPEDNPGIDGDPRLHIVNASPLAMCDVTLETAATCGRAGYLSAFDLIPAAVDPDSNAREMFVMNVDYFGTDFYLTVLAHELRHLIEGNYDSGDADWAAEGGAMLAEELVGFPGNGVQRANLFLEEPDQQLNRWTDGNTIPYYGQGYLFNRFLYDRLGADNYRQFADSPAYGFRAIDAVAADNGLPVTGESLWLDWLVALAIHDRTDAPDEYRFHTSGLDTAAQTVIDDLPIALNESVHQYAADYYRLEGQGRMTLSFTGTSLVPLLDTMPPSGEGMWLTSRTNYSQMRLTRAVDLREVSSATLNYSIYYDIEYGYDFAYVYVSQDGGRTWDSLAAPHMEGTRVEDDPSGSALADRFYTGRSETWQDESIDLSPFAGQEIQIRFVYLTDPILTYGGLAIDNISIPEIGFFDDAESIVAGWVGEGFHRVTAAMPQVWHLQLITFPDGGPEVEKLDVIPGQPLIHSVSLDDSRGQAILIVAAASPMTLELAHYQLQVVNPTSETPAGSQSGTVTGSVVVEEGRCCTGGTAGDTIDIEATFEANSTAAAITDMRVFTAGVCRTESDMAEVDWEPFVPTKSFPFHLPINWVGFYVSVQYRDAAGNISAVFCDDISVEGMPPTPES